MNVLSQKRKTKKKHREIDLNQINHQTFEKQKMISSSSQKKAENDQNLRMIHNLRENIFKESKEKLFSFPLLNDRRNNLICQFKNYQEYLQNRKKFVEIRGNIDDQIKLNKEMTEELQKRREIRKEFEKMKEELAKINKEKEIVDDIVNDIQIKVNEINKIKSLSKVQKMHYFDSLFNINIDAQNTQELSQYFHSDDSLCNAEVLTDSPPIFEMNDNSMRNFIKDLENQIKEIEKSISEQKVQVVLLLQKLKEQEQRKLKEFDKTLQYIQGKLI
ncbi:hypothetical protein TRFO_35784 [Tritrichomonas foetus]|uniref:DUF4200 domain-containing protein n=1 Tax=Tritrichomonas foetus TaxID=1144522 RepID=A0A1J4JK32_9EUKA|nr:hypothetical protein TRFO_35784 [Tritrichomonas foetus]|eukprot:OHS97909.1 hypothetical protein TRFO_35784 [Tritrichomonas foetus]